MTGWDFLWIWSGFIVGSMLSDLLHDELPSEGLTRFIAVPATVATGIACLAWNLWPWLG